MRGIVVAPQPQAVEVGVDVLESGGNAFDAAVAAGYMQMVVDPFMCGLGGWGAATLRRGDTGETEHIGFWARIGSRMSPDMWADDVEGFTDLWRFALFADDRNVMGHTSIMTPGTVAGFDAIHRRHATRPFGDLIAPAIEASRSGFPWPAFVALRNHQPSVPGLPETRIKYANTPAAEALFHRPDGSLREAGEWYANPDQAATMERLARSGARDFYDGELAAAISADFDANGAFVTAEDLAGYQPVIEAPLHTTYRGLDVFSCAAPGGGPLTLQVLNILEQFDLAAMDHSGPEHAFIVGAALAWVGVTRGRHHADPGFHPVPLEELLSKEHAQRIAERIRRGELPDRKALNIEGFTTQLTVMDEAGNCVSITHTLTTCSGVVVPGTGFTWNDCVALMDPMPGRPNSYEPGKARASAISPTIIERDGQPWMTVGAPGGWSISSAVSQAISNVVDFGMSPVEAVIAPRLHSEGTPVYAEQRIHTRVVAAMEARGMHVVHSPHVYEPAFGTVQMALWEDGRFSGGSDPRRSSGAVGVARQQ